MLGLMLGTAALRVALAAGTGLGIDESYMVAAGRTLQWSYFDHPGLSWWLNRGVALAVGSEAPIVVRLPFIALFVVSTWLMFVLTRRLFGERAGLWAAVGLNLSPVFSVTTGTWVLPDGPLVCVLLAGVYGLVRAVDAAPSPRPWSAPQPKPEGGRGGVVGNAGATMPPLPCFTGEGRGEGLASPWIWWPLTGLFAGLALLSKYSAALVLIGAIPYLVVDPRRWLRRPHPYVAAAVAAACCAPIVIWNAQHGWASFAFQGGRAASAALHPFGPPATLAGEALFIGPWIWLPLMGAWLRALREGPRAGAPWLLACLGAGPIVLFVVVSFWARHVLFHWAAPGYLMLFPLLGARVARMEIARPRLLRAGWRTGAALILAGWALLLIEARINLLAPFGTDPGLQALDWTPLRDQLAERGLLRPGLVIGGANWQDTGKLDYGFGGSVPVLCLNPDARQYLFAPGTGSHRGEDILLIGPRLTARTFAAAFDAIETLPPLRLRDTAIPVFLGRNWHGG